MRKVTIRNMTGKEFRVMLEPITFSEDIPAEKQLTIEGKFEDELIIDIAEEVLVSIWSPVGATMKLK